MLAIASHYLNREAASRGAERAGLARVSMAHLVESLQAATGLPVFSSLETSLVAVKETPGIG